MSKYNLEANESIIIKSERVRHGGIMSFYTDELILTSLNIILVKKGTFGNTKGVYKYPINQIKVFNDEVQAKLVKHKNVYYQLEIYFENSIEIFGFEKKKEVLKWIDNISIVLTGKSSDFVSSERNVIPGTEFVAETLRGTFDTFKDAFGIESPKNNKDIAPMRKTKKCASCMAPLSGEIGQTIRCKYCDTEQII